LKPFRTGVRSEELTLKMVFGLGLGGLFGLE
jgi:hypothetical protein